MSEDRAMEFEFEGVIEAGPRGGAWLRVPFDTAEAFGTRRSVRVKAEYDGFSADSNIVSMGDGPVLGIHKATRKSIGKDVGDIVQVRFAADSRPRTVDVPAELATALGKSSDAEVRYGALSFTHRREFAQWVGGAKKVQTRRRRADKAVEMLLSGKTL